MKKIITQNGAAFYQEDIEKQTNTNHSVYEVIRIVDGVALFLEDHYNRLIASIQMSGFRFEMNYLEFRQHIAELVQLNNQQNGNVKLVVFEAHGTIQWSFSFIPHSYPTSDDYLKGVATGLLFAERENPNAKVIQSSLRDRANALMAAKQLYEVLLVDQKGMITEGSRSNVFFVIGNQFYTAPASAVLVGITRTKILECLKEFNFKVIEEAIPSTEIETIDAAFLTGTSPKVLPVNCIDTVQYTIRNPFIEQLMARYELMIESYLKTHQFE